MNVQKDIVTGLSAHLEERFDEMDSDITISLLESDAEYKALRERLEELEQRFPFIESVLDGEGAVRLTAEEHAGLVEYIRVADEAENRERLNLYYAGHRDCFSYLRKIRIL
jgi:hypothetical protein